MASPLISAFGEVLTSAHDFYHTSAAGNKQPSSAGNVRGSAADVTTRFRAQSAGTLTKRRGWHNSALRRGSLHNGAFWRVAQSEKFFHRRAAATPEERRRIERWLATSRVALAFAALFAIASSSSGIAYAVVTLYLIFSLAVMLFFGSGGGHRKCSYGSFTRSTRPGRW